MFSNSNTLLFFFSNIKAIIGAVINKTVKIANREDPGQTASSVLSVYFQSDLNTVWILISWLVKKPADQDPQCIQRRINLSSTGQELT